MKMALDDADLSSRTLKAMAQANIREVNYVKCKKRTTKSPSAITGKQISTLHSIVPFQSAIAEVIQKFSLLFFLILCKHKRIHPDIIYVWNPAVWVHFSTFCFCILFPRCSARSPISYIHAEKKRKKNFHKACANSSFYVAICNSKLILLVDQKTKFNTTEVLCIV